MRFLTPSIGQCSTGIEIPLIKYFPWTRWSFNNADYEASSSTFEDGISFIPPLIKHTIYLFV